MTHWPGSRAEIVELQEALAREQPSPWRPPAGPLAVAACFVCFARGGSGPGAAGDPAWAAAVLVRDRRAAESAVIRGGAGAPYELGLLALREGPLLETAVRCLPEQGAVLLADATGRDHPRRAGLALHLGWVLELPTVGVTHRPLLASGSWPADTRGAVSPLLLDGECVGFWVRTRPGVRPLAVHAGWRTDPESAVEIVLAATERARTPEPLRQARRIARAARARGQPVGK